MQSPTIAHVTARWRRAFGARCRRRRGRRPLAALGYLANGPVTGGLIGIENLMLAVLYDQSRPDGRTATYLAGFAGVPGPWGVRFGGMERDLVLSLLAGQLSCQ